MDLVSVIIPVYNAEKYLEQCLDSILSQTYKNIEVIIVDDGSTDNSLFICKSYCKSNKNIKLITKKNEGVSIARNEGIKIATGEWIIFLDSDDWMKSNAIMDAINLVNLGKYDTICWNYTKLVDDKFFECKKIDEITLNKREDLVKILYSIIESSYHECNYFGEYIRAPWAKMLNKKIIEDNNIRFNENLYIGEDAIFLLEYFSYVKNVKFINKYNNIYRIIQTSSVRKYKNDLDRQITFQLEIMNIIMKDISDVNINTLKIVIGKFYLNSIYELICNYKLKKENEKNIFNISEFIENYKFNLPDISISLLSKKQKLIYILIKYNKIKLLEVILEKLIKLGLIASI